MTSECVAHLLGWSQNILASLFHHFLYFYGRSLERVLYNIGTDPYIMFVIDTKA